jgi:hypothetical protein
VSGRRESAEIKCLDWLYIVGPIRVPEGLPYKAGVAWDFVEADIVYSAEKVGEDAHGDMTPKFGKYGNDDRGHLVSATLGGLFTPENTVSQSLHINRGGIAQFEKNIRQSLTDNRDWTAHLRIDILYRIPDCDSAKSASREMMYRPTEFLYSVYYTDPAGAVMREGYVDTKPFINGGGM